MTRATCSGARPEAHALTAHKTIRALFSGRLVHTDWNRWRGIRQGLCLLRTFSQSRDGNFAVLTAIVSLPLFAAVAAVIDLVSVENKADKLQHSLDTAALVIATQYYSGMSDAELETIGNDFFGSNINVGYTKAGGFEYVSDLDAEATAAGPYDEVVVRASIAHQGILASRMWKASRESVVRIAPALPACVLALDKHAGSSVKMQGSAVIDMPGCVIASNSDSSEAISRGGAAKVSAECVTAVGGTSGLTSSSRVDLECGAPLENQYPSSDPLSAVVPPSYTSCQKMPEGKGAKILSPGTYCNQTIAGEVTLKPGNYLLRGGEIKLGGNGSLVGEKVTIFLMENAQLHIGANQLIQLSPPDSGEYAGITIYQEMDNTSALTINGTAKSDITGFIYAPGAHVFHAGNAAVSSEGKCLRIVANTVELTGNSSIRLDCEDELGGREMYAGRRMAIVR